MVADEASLTKRRGFRLFKRKKDKTAKETTASVAKSTTTSPKKKATTAATTTSGAPSTAVAPTTTTKVVAAVPKSPEKKQAAVMDNTKASWLCRSKTFRKMCDDAFELIDTDGSGSVDDKELYAGLLLIHLNLGMYAGPAACRPLGRERCHAVFMKMDVDGSGSLDKEEFRNVMMVLFSNVVMRVLVQWSMTLMIVPLVAQYLLDGIYWLWQFSMEWITTLDEHYAFADKVEVFLEESVEKGMSLLPASALAILDVAGDYVEMVPDTVWNSIPLTLLSTILGILVVPWIIFKIDDFFQYLAERNNPNRAAV